MNNRPASSVATAPYAVILAGGSGTRFWPASRRSKPKQLLAVAPGDSRCLLAAVVERLSPLCSPNRVFVSTGQHLLDATRTALPQLPKAAFLGEPLARNTAPCIAWATMKVAQRDPRAVVIVVPSDQHITDEPAFLEALRHAVGQAQLGHIATLGIKPTRPETGYGYLQRAHSVGETAYAVKRFVEKPDRETAQRYLDSCEYYWNSGIFVYRADVMLDALGRHKPALRAGVDTIARATKDGPSAEVKATEEFFQTCEAVSIDYAVMEKENDLRMVACDAGWSDLGSWQTIWELADKWEGQNASNRPALFVDAHNNLVFDLDNLQTGGKPSSDAIALVGVSDLCVIRSGGSLLVIPRDRTQDVRKVVEALRLADRDDLL